MISNYFSKTGKKHSNQRGSATVVALMGVSLLGFSVGAAMMINNQIHSAAKVSRMNEAASSFVQTMSMILADPTLCRRGAPKGGPDLVPNNGNGNGNSGNNNGNGNNNNDGSNSQFGLRFRGNGNGNNSSRTVNDGLANNPDGSGQRIRIMTPFNDPDDDRGLFVQDGVTVEELGLIVERIEFRQTSVTGDIHRGVVRVSLSGIIETTPAGPRTYPLAMREIANLYIDDSNANGFQCWTERAAVTALGICTDMGCRYDETDSDQNGQLCDCPLPPITCADQGPDSYITGLRVSDGGDVVPICGQATYACTDQPNQYLEGFDAQGNWLCATIQPAPADGACGSASGKIYADASALNADSENLCTSGVASVTTFSGDAPWTWTCPGTDGGDPVSCTTGGDTETALCYGWEIYCDIASSGCETYEWKYTADTTKPSMSCVPGDAPCGGTSDGIQGPVKITATSPLAPNCDGVGPSDPSDPSGGSLSSCDSWVQAACTGAAVERVPVGAVSTSGTGLTAAPQSAVDSCTTMGGSCLQAEAVLDRDTGLSTGEYKLFCHTGEGTAPYQMVNGSGTWTCGSGGSEPTGGSTGYWEIVALGASTTPLCDASANYLGDCDKNPENTSGPLAGLPTGPSCKLSAGKIPSIDGLPGGDVFLQCRLCKANGENVMGFSLEACTGDYVDGGYEPLPGAIGTGPQCCSGRYQCVDGLNATCIP